MSVFLHETIDELFEKNGVDAEGAARCVRALLNKRPDVARHLKVDHGISPAQLREKVEALEKRHENAIKMCAACDANTREAFEHVMSRLDTALKRIEAADLVIKEQYRAIDALNKRVEELEKLVTAWRGTQKYEPPIENIQSKASYVPTPEEDARRQRAIEHINAVNERIAAQKAAKT